MARIGGEPIAEGMRVVSSEPLNVETDLGAHRGVITPTPLFYHRNHFPIPESWQGKIEVGGAVERPQTLHDAHLWSMRSRTLTVTMECAGNGRSGFRPQAEGESWEYAAVSTAEWTGVPLRDVLERAGVLPGAVEILVEGADRGHVDAAGRTISYVRSLPIEKAMDLDVILAVSMNGEGVPRAHGGPVRLIVPGWYGMASVKWVTRIEALTEPFRGFYQVERYVMPDGVDDMVPLGAMRVRSLITSPLDAQIVALELPTQFRVRGLAWSGGAPVTRVEVSADNGATWHEAELTSREEPYAWRRWEWLWEIARPGEATLLSRAFDAAGNTQPFEPEWNRLGYANNAIRPIPVPVRLQSG